MISLFQDLLNRIIEERRTKEDQYWLAHWATCEFLLESQSS
jgi:hypothetical protein